MFRRRDEGAAAAPANVYQMHQRMFSIGDDFWIENGAGQRQFKVDGKALRIRKTLELQGPDGRALYTIKEKLVSVREVMTIEGPSGTVATVKKALISPLRERYNIEHAAGGEWKAQGNIVDHQYEVEGRPGRSPRSRSAGSGSATPTASRSARARTTPSCWPSRS